MTADPAVTSGRIDRRELGWALVLSVPVGVGVAFAVTRMTGGGVLDPLALGAGVAAAAGIFAVVVASLLTPGNTNLDGPRGR